MAATVTMAGNAPPGAVATGDHLPKMVFG